MAQNTVNYADNPTGPELLDNYLAKEQENSLSSNSGIQRPSYAASGTLWLDTSVTPWLYKMYDGSSDVTIGSVNSSTHSFTASGVNESNFVHKTGAETISGIKTFTTAPYSEATFGANIYVKTKSTDYTQTPSGVSDVTGSFTYIDKNDIPISEFSASHYSNGTGYAGIMLRNHSGTRGFLNLGFSSNGSFYTYAPGPSLASNASGYGNQIVTVGYFNNNAVKLTTDQTIAGIKIFTNNSTWSKNNPTLYLKNTGQTKGTVPVEEKITGICFRDSANNTMGLVRQRYETNKDNYVELRCYNANTADSDDVTSLRLVNTAAGDHYVIAPASNIASSVVTTVDLSATASDKNGLKLGNGIKINWGKTNALNNNPKSPVSTNFKYAFDGTHYTVILIPSDGTTVNNEYGAYVVSKATGSFSAILRGYEGGSVNRVCDYVAIGK